jgi:hypothetical protein
MSIILDLSLIRTIPIFTLKVGLSRLPCQPPCGSFPKSHNKSVDTYHSKRWTDRTVYD